MTTARDPGFVAELSRRVRGGLKTGERLSRYSTYRIGGPATVVLPAEPEDVAETLRLAHRFEVSWFVLGLGSNVLLPDEGLEAVVIRIGKGLDRTSQEQDRWRLGAGLPAPIVARRTAEAGWAGLHMMIGVPGTVGGGVFMNAGCHGGQWSDVVETVVGVNEAGDSRVFSRSDIAFGYRSSGLAGWVVLETTVRLLPRPADELSEEVGRLLSWRQQGTPFNQACCGSVFKNPDAARSGGRTAGQLIDAAGLKGRRVGGVEVSLLHGNYFVNTGQGTAADVRRLIDEVQYEVASRFGVRLEPEVRIIGTAGQLLGPG